MEAWEAKVLSAGVTLLVIGFCTGLPAFLSAWFYKRGDAGLMAMRICRCFGAGSFLGAFLMNLLPEIDHLMQRVARDG